MSLCPALHVGACDVNAGPPACEEGTLRPSHLPCFILFLKKKKKAFLGESVEVIEKDLIPRRNQS